MSRRAETGINAFDLLGDVAPAMREALPADTNFYVVGGIAAAALKDPKTQFEIEESTGQVIAPVDLFLSTIRENGSRRDIDLYVGTILEREQASDLKSRVSEAIGHNLEVSISGNEPRVPMKMRRKMGLWFTDFISHRMQDEDGGLYYALDPCEIKLQPASFDPHTLVTPSKDEVPILHPVGTASAYDLRSISGTRPKDKEKVYEMQQNIYQHPEFVEQREDGVFKEWKLFADAIAKLNRGEMPPQSTLRERTTMSDIRAFQRRAKLLGSAERHGKVVSAAQSELVKRALNVLARVA